MDDSAEQAAVFVRKDEEDEEENDEGEHDGEGSDKPASGDDAADAEMEDADENKARKEKDSEEEEDDEAPGKKRKATAAGKGAKGKKAKKEESEEEEEEESDEDDEEEKLYAACKLLSGVACPPTRRPWRRRPREARRRVFTATTGTTCSPPAPAPVRALSTARASAASMSQQFGQKAEPEAVRAAKEREIHNDFLRLLFKLLNGTVESSNFEDDCRTLLGANSYVLFTLDKLIYKIVKQIQSLLADENATKLLHLLDYEKSRKSPLVEAIYHANASVLLLDSRATCPVRMDDGASLTLQLMESGLDKADLPAGTMEAQFHDYLESFLRTSADEEDEEDGGKPWMADLRRAAGRAPRRSKTAAGLDQGPDAMGQTSVQATRWSARSPAATRRFRTSSTPRTCFTAEWAPARVRARPGRRGGGGGCRQGGAGQREIQRVARGKAGDDAQGRRGGQGDRSRGCSGFRHCRRRSRAADVETHEEELAEEDADDAEDGDASRRRRATRTTTTKPSKPTPPRMKRWRTPRATSRTSRRRRRNNDDRRRRRRRGRELRASELDLMKFE